jgi:hypothetical protein
VSRVAHLVSRFFTSLFPRRLDEQTTAWVHRALASGELHLWEGLDRADRAEAVGVAQRFEAELAATELNETGREVDPDWIAAALLHDVGKQASAFGPVGRVLATVVVALAGKDRARAWARHAGGVRARIGRYAAHDTLGAELLEVAGSSPAAREWAGAHHRPDRWAGTGIPLDVCRALARADGEPADARPR